VEVNLENYGLQSVLTGETELRDDRNNEEVYAYSLVCKDLKQSVTLAEEERRKIRKQKETVTAYGDALEKSMAEGKQRSQEISSNLK